MKTQKSTTKCSFVEIVTLKLAIVIKDRNGPIINLDSVARSASLIFLFHQRFLLLENVYFLIFFFFQKVGRPCPPSLPAPTFARALTIEFNSVEFWTNKKHQKKKNSIGVSQSNILIDATISSSFQIKPWGYEEMKNSDENVNIRAFCDVRNWRKNWRKRKRYLGRRNYSPIRDDYDDMIYTLLLTNVNTYTGRVCDYPYQGLFIWARFPRSRLTSKSFVKFSVCSYKRAGWLGSRDLGFFNRDLGKRAENFAIGTLHHGYRDERRDEFWRSRRHRLALPAVFSTS